LKAAEAAADDHHPMRFLFHAFRALLQPPEDDARDSGRTRSR
jgi:hypothetical protein